MIKSGKKKVIVIDQKFNGLSLVEQNKLVTDLFPVDFKEEFDVETRVLLEDNEIRHVEIMRDIVAGLDKVPATAQLLLYSSISHYESDDGVMAADAAWLAGSRQLRNFLLYYGFEADDHKLKKLIVGFLLHCCTDKALEEKLSSSWDSIETAHSNSYDDYGGLEKVRAWIYSAETFCNTIQYIHEKKLFKREDLLKWALRSKQKFKEFQKLKILHEEYKDVEIIKTWKELKDIYTENDIINK
ncbi:hypothetical protein ACQ4LE_002780 [Meloidogyne hapla]